MEEPSQQWIPSGPLLKSSQSINEVRKSVQELLELGAIRPCNQIKNQFISSYFLVEKSNKKFRFVLNLKKLNSFIETVLFKLEDGRSAAKLLSQGDFLAKIDLNNAYFSVLINKNSQKYLRFLFEDQCYEFVCLPFGLNIAPWLFTKILKPVLQYLRKKGFRSVAYLDDILCFGRTKEECNENLVTTINLLTSLGFSINREKTVLEPTNVIEFQGLKYNSLAMTLELPETMKQDILNRLSFFSRVDHCSLR